MFRRPHGSQVTTPDSAPYGPNTRLVRRFLVQLAALGASARAAIIERYATIADTRQWVRAELSLAQAIESAGRVDAQSALCGPLLQLLGKPKGDSNDDIDPIAEPALAALLSLVALDLIPPDVQTTLYQPFADEIPLERIQS